jgi:signal-transduction protein with cAMP-binding, CBS, and nucleotidyltransferase domain
MGRYGKTSLLSEKGGIAVRQVLEDQEEHALRSVTAQLLAEIPLFSALDEQERGELSFLMVERLFQPGEVVMQAGEPEGAFHMIDQGEVELWLMDTEGKKVVLDVHSAASSRLFIGTNKGQRAEDK